jgi:hypothetical protein
MASVGERWRCLAGLCGTGRSRSGKTLKDSFLVTLQKERRAPVA